MWSYFRRTTAEKRGARRSSPSVAEATEATERPVGSVKASIRPSWCAAGAAMWPAPRCAPATARITSSTSAATAAPWPSSSASAQLISATRATRISGTLPNCPNTPCPNAPPVSSQSAVHSYPSSCFYRWFLSLVLMLMLMLILMMAMVMKEILFSFFRYPVHLLFNWFECLIAVWVSHLESCG